MIGIVASYAAAVGQVLGQVSVTPDAAGMPGGALIQKLLNWGQMIALWGVARGDPHRCGDRRAVATGRRQLLGCREREEADLRRSGGRARGRPRADDHQHAVRGGQVMRGASLRTWFWNLRERNRTVYLLTSWRQWCGLLVMMFAFWMAYTTGEASDCRPGYSPGAASVVGPIEGSAPEGSLATIDGPDEYRAHMPVGFAESENGARAAGVAYAADVEQKMMYLDDPSISRAQREISAEGRRDQLVAERHRSVGTWRASLDPGEGQLWWVVSPLASRVESYTADRARVLVWVSFVVSRSGATAPRVWFGIQAIDLVREGEDWKIWAQSLDDGPTPQSSPGSKPSDATELAERLDGFQLDGADR